MNACIRPRIHPVSILPYTSFYGSTAQFGKKSPAGFLSQFKVWKTKEYCMYPQGVCRIRKPACAGNGCAIFLVFQTEEVGQKDG